MRFNGNTFVYKTSTVDAFTLASWMRSFGAMDIRHSAAKAGHRVMNYRQRL